MKKKLFIQLFIVSLAAWIYLFFYNITHASYISIIDAGSTGSRIHLFEVSAQKTIVVKEIPVSSAKINPGLASFAGTSQGQINAYLKPLTTALAKTLKQNKIIKQEVSVQLMATAGMRTLSHEQQIQLEDDVITVLTDNGYQATSVSAVTITGKMEGVYAWVALNYIKGTLSGTTKTSGIAEMGGASTQIAFAISKYTQALQKDLYKFSFNGQHYTIYSHSYLGLGESLSRAQFANDNHCFLPDYIIPNKTTTDGNYAQCKFDNKPLVTEVAKVQPVANLLGNTPLYLLGAFYYIANSEPFNFSSKMTLSNFEKKAAAFCTIKWKKAQQKYPNDPYLYHYCFDGAYYSNLLTNGYGINSNMTVHPIKKINDILVDWTLGAALLSIHPK
ncbi:MAG: hypothetical protein OXC48_08190 [Endozoicomonadaceae bacterium]|nr:hypothetical protein [Endozoicomonadaceae bacterium]